MIKNNRDASWYIVIAVILLLNWPPSFVPHLRKSALNTGISQQE